ncbi:hypothetical protein E2C01_070217 [Portunus trituberculatus]|uniref:Uncharacterized protein n=1 Tax=Portunus trituberculatus TaxID=210409 RepID=A0A5B7HTL3_PORTR|nr:hypothetical protein [Portunus trituberculatus]
MPPETLPPTVTSLICAHTGTPPLPITSHFPIFSFKPGATPHLPLNMTFHTHTDTHNTTGTRQDRAEQGGAGQGMESAGQGRAEQGRAGQDRAEDKNGT